MRKALFITAFITALAFAGCASGESSSSKAGDTAASEAAPSETAASEAEAEEDTEAASEENEEVYLVFRMGDSADGEEIITNRNVVDASAETRSVDGSGTTYSVKISLDYQGKDAFYNATYKAAASGEKISIWYDDEMIIAPSVSAPIYDGVFEINGNFTYEEAARLAARLRGEDFDELS